MSNIFFVHMSKDVGRYMHFKNLQKMVGGSIWDGKCVIPMDDKGYILNKPTQPMCTQAAKEAKIKLFSHFLKTNKEDDKLILFEDDLIWHKDFEKNFKLMIDNAKYIDNWKLIYFGVSSSVEYDIKQTLQKVRGTNDLELTTLDASLKVYTGAYGVIINRNILQEIIDRAQVPELKGKPFDATCLGYMQKKYQGNCFLAHPQQILADVSGSNIRHNRNQIKFNEAMSWDINKYVKPIKIPFIVLVDNNVEKIKRFLYQCNCLMPIIQLHFILTVLPTPCMKEYLIKCKTNGITSSVINSKKSKNVNYILKHHIITNNLIQKNKYNIFFITNSYIGWNNNLTKNMFYQVENAMGLINTIDGIMWYAKCCGRCNNKNITINTKIPYYALSCVKIMSFIQKEFDKLEFLTFESNVYSTLTCLEISDNNFHNLTLDEIKTALSTVPNPYLKMDGPKQYYGETVWIHTVIKWLHKYFYGTILNMVEEEYDENSYSHEIYAGKHYSSKFSTVEFNLLKFVKEIISNGLIFSMNRTFIKNTFGTYEAIEFESLCKKSGIKIPSYDFSIMFK